MSRSNRRKRKGAPITLTPDIQKAVCSALRAGNYIETACLYAKIGKTTFYDWLSRGEEEQEKPKKRGQEVDPEIQSLIEFSNAVREAIAHGEMVLVNSVEKHANGRPAKRDEVTGDIVPAIENDWKAAAWMLERKFPDRWASKTQQNVKVFPGKRGEDPGFKPDGSYEKLLKILNAIESKDDQE